MNAEIEAIFKKLSTDFYGHVEVHYVDGVPAYVKIQNTIKLRKDTPGNDRTNPLRTTR